MPDTPSSYEQLRDRFTEECVLHALDRTEDREIVLILDGQTGRIYRVLTATRGCPDSGWFVLALGGPTPNAPFMRQLRIHDSDAHHVCIVEKTVIDPSTTTPTEDRS